MYKGQLEGFPQEVVEKMLDEQEAQGNKRDVSVFEAAVNSGAYDGFDWNDTVDGYYFWQRVIGTKDFDLFFEKYPKKQMFKRGDKILVWNIHEENNEEMIALTYIDGAKFPVVCVFNPNDFINGKEFTTSSWMHWKPIQQVTEVTMEENNMKKQILNWAKKRNIDSFNNRFQQLAKLTEEVGELNSAVLKQNKAEIIDAIGDIQVVLIILSKQLNIDFDKALEIAWNEIKDRTGETINGTFIKSN